MKNTAVTTFTRIIRSLPLPTDVTVHQQQDARVTNLPASSKEAALLGWTQVLCPEASEPTLGISFSEKASFLRAGQQRSGEGVRTVPAEPLPLIPAQAGQGEARLQEGAGSSGHAAPACGHSRCGSSWAPAPLVWRSAAGRGAAPRPG